MFQTKIFTFLSKAKAFGDSEVETNQGMRKLFKGGNYSRKFGTYLNLSRKIKVNKHIVAITLSY